MYDVYGNRIEESVDADGAGSGTAAVTRFVLDGWNPIKPAPVGNENWDVFADLDGSNDLRTRYLRSDVVDELFGRLEQDGATTVSFWVLEDNQGSVRDVVDSNGDLVKSMTYDAFGNIVTDVGAGDLGRYGWTGREIVSAVEVGLQYNRGRYYDAPIGRWISQDPMGFAAGDSNLYRYLGNNPTHATDPSGLYETDLHFYMTFYLAQAVGLGDKLTNLGGPKNTTAAFALAWFAQQVDDNRLTSPVVKKNVVNESLQFWHFYSADLKVGLIKGRGKLIKALQELSDGKPFAGDYFKSRFPLPVLANNPLVQDLLTNSMRYDRSDSTFGMVLHTYEDSWSHEGYSAPFGHASANNGGHAPDLPWLDPDRAMQMAEEVYNRMAIYARVKYGIAQPKVGWQVIKQELETLMRTTINTTLSPEDQAKFKAGGIEGLALHKRDQSMRIDAWKEAIHNRFKVGVGYFAVPPDVRWLTAFEEAERLVKPRKGFIQEFKDAQTFVTWYNEAYKRFKLREPIVGDKDWFRLLKNVSAAVISGD